MKLFRVSLMLSAAIGLVFLNGCASIMCGPEKTVSVRSTPPSEFKIKDSNGQVIVEDTAPTNVTLRRGSGWFQAGNYTVEFEKAGYKNTTAPINQGVEAWYGLGNIVFGGFIGWVIVDPATGAMWDIKDLHVSMDKLPEKGAQSQSGGDE